MANPDIADFTIRWVEENIGPGPYPFIECEDPLSDRMVERFISDAEQAGISFARLESAVAGVRGFVEDAFDLVTDPATVPNSPD